MNERIIADYSAYACTEDGNIQRMARAMAQKRALEAQYRREEAELERFMRGFARAEKMPLKCAYDRTEIAEEQPIDITEETFKNLREMELKKCSVCGEEKPKSEFYAGFHMCKKCKQEKMKAQMDKKKKMREESIVPSEAKADEAETVLVYAPPAEPAKSEAVTLNKKKYTIALSVNASIDKETLCSLMAEIGKAIDRLTTLGLCLPGITVNVSIDSCLTI